MNITFSNSINIHRVTSVVDAEAYVGRLKNVQTYLGEVGDQLALRADKGFYLVDWMYPAILQSSSNVISGQPFDDSENLLFEFILIGMTLKTLFDFFFLSKYRGSNKKDAQ